MHSNVFVYRNCRKQTEWGLCRLTSQITPLSDISYKQIGSPPPLKQLLRVSILLPQCKSVLSSNCFKKNSYPSKGNVKGQSWTQISTMDIQFLKGLISFVFSFIFVCCILFEYSTLRFCMAAGSPRGQ